MANVRATWVLPVVRESGGPLDPSEISSAVVEVSADGGASWGGLGSIPPSDPQTALLENPAPGSWMFRITILDTDGRSSSLLDGVIMVPDETAPGPATDLVLTLE